MLYDNLKKECDRQGLKITPIVLECGGNKGSLSGWKKGASPNSDIVMKLSVRLNVPTDYLLFGDEANEKVSVIPTIQHTNAVEAEMLRLFRLLPEAEQLKLLGRTEVLVELAEQAKAEDNAV